MFYTYDFIEHLNYFLFQSYSSASRRATLYNHETVLKYALRYHCYKSFCDSCMDSIHGHQSCSDHSVSVMVWFRFVKDVSTEATGKKQCYIQTILYNRYGNAQ